MMTTRAGDSVARETKMGRPNRRYLDVVSEEMQGARECEAFDPKCTENPVWRTLMGKDERRGILHFR